MSLLMPTSDTKPSQEGSGPSSRVTLMTGCLFGLLLLNLVQIAAGLAGIEPSPAEDVIPIIAATAAIGLVAVPMVMAGERLGYQIGIVFSLVSMIGMGPHKLLLEDGSIIAPVALVGFAAEVAFLWAASRELRAEA